MSIFDPFGTRNHAAAERSIFGNTAGAFGAGMVGLPNTPPASFLGASSYNAFFALGSIPRYAAQGLYHGARNGGGLFGAAMSGPFYLAGDLWKVRREAADRANRARARADSMDPYPSSINPIDDGAFRERYGRSLNPEYEAVNASGRRTMSLKDRAIYGRFNPRKFGVRTPMEHMKRGGQNLLSQSVLGPMSWGINAAIAGFTSSDNILDPREGFAAKMAENIGAEVGFGVGGTIAASIAAAAIPGVGMVAGAAKMASFLVGGLAGATTGISLPGMAMDIAEWGAKNGRHGKLFRAGFQDSEHAATMRQRGLQSIYRSQMSARSAFGSEALSYHS